MKNKRITYIFLILSVIIWGTIIYKIVSRSDNVGYMTDSSPSTDIQTSESTEIPDTFHLLINYKDPFLKSMIKKQPVTNIDIAKKFVRRDEQVNKRTTVIWPKIVYNGMVSGKGSNDELCILRINDKVNLLKKGEEFNGLKPENIWKDSIQLSFKKETKTLIR